MTWRYKVEVGDDVVLQETGWICRVEKVDNVNGALEITLSVPYDPDDEALADG